MLKENFQNFLIEKATNEDIVKRGEFNQQSRVFEAYVARNDR